MSNQDDGQVKGQQDSADERPGVTRREFVSTTAAGAAAFMIVPRHVLGRGMQAPSDILNIATIGLNGMGGNNTEQVMSENIVAFCDVDYGLLDRRIKRWQDAVNPPEAAAGGGRAGGAGGGGGQGRGGGAGGGGQQQAPNPEEVLRARW